MSENILNLTQHIATAEQVEAGVVEPKDKALVKGLLNFTERPTMAVIFERAEALAKLAQEEGVTKAMIGGAGYLMGPLELALANVGVAAVHSFTERKVTEVTKPDGTLEKVSVFKHVGWVGID